jgi:hypothetical protein
MTIKDLFALSLLTVIASGCVEAEDELELFEEEQEIQGGSYASSFQRQRAAKLRNCSATVITSRHAITAIHCNPAVGDSISLYGSSVVPTSSATITAVTIRAGTAIYADGGEDWTDLEGRLADFAILEFSPARRGSAADLAWAYPGSDRTGFVVGAGDHDGNDNTNGLLLQSSAETFSDDDDSGGFYTNVHVTNGGDSGGAFYESNRLLGVTHGAHWLGVWRGRFTSVAEHLPFILGAIDWDWSGTSPEQRFRTGENLQLFVGTQKVCQYACTKTSACVAYNWMTSTSQCFLLGSVISSVSSSAFRSALK